MIHKISFAVAAYVTDMSTVPSTYYTQTSNSSFGHSVTALDWDSLSSKTCEKLGGDAIGSGCDTPLYVPDVFFLSCLLFLGTFALCMALKHFRSTRFFPNKVK